MMIIDIGRWLRAVRSKIETPTQDDAFARIGPRWLASLIAVLLGGAVICASLAITTPWSAADAQGLEAGGGLGQARERARKTTERRKAATRRFGKAAERAAAQRAKEKRHRFVKTLKRAERAAAQRVKEKHRR